MEAFKKIGLAMLLIAFCTYSANRALAQGAPPPPPAVGHGATGNQPPTGGNAPITNGVYLLLSLGAVYGLTKVWVEKRKANEI